MIEIRCYHEFISLHVKLNIHISYNNILLRRDVSLYNYTIIQSQINELREELRTFTSTSGQPVREGRSDELIIVYYANK